MCHLDNIKLYTVSDFSIWQQSSKVQGRGTRCIFYKIQVKFSKKQIPHKDGGRAFKFNMCRCKCVSWSFITWKHLSIQAFMSFYSIHLCLTMMSKEYDKELWCEEIKRVCGIFSSKSIHKAYLLLFWCHFTILLILILIQFKFKFNNH